MKGLNKAPIRASICRSREAQGADDLQGCPDLANVPGRVLCRVKKKAGNIRWQAGATHESCVKNRRFVNALQLRKAILNSFADRF